MQLNIAYFASYWKNRHKITTAHHPRLDLCPVETSERISWWSLYRHAA